MLAGDPPEERPRMISEPELELLYKFANAPVRKFPYPQFFIEGVFPKDFTIGCNLTHLRQFDLSSD
jgi:hypothetical protein